MEKSETVKGGAGEGILLSGSMVDHFRIIGLIGRGGMGEVYLARDTKLGRKVALKRIHSEAIGSVDAVERFLFEAQVTAQFNHPHIVTIFAVGETPGGPYVALEYLEGETLRQRMESESLSLRECMRIGLAIAEGLKEAHGHGVLHRDLKPKNVMITKDGRLRVLDFGLAKVVAGPDASAEKVAAAMREPDAPLEDEASSAASMKGTKGTPRYMAPEQWDNKPSSGATDVWALGVILYEAVTGVHPFQGQSVNQLACQVCSPEPVPSAGSYKNVPLDLAGLIARCLEKDSRRRPTAAEVVGELERLLSGDGTKSVEELSPFRGFLPFTERHAGYFFGRDEEIAAFLERMREETVLPVVGSSGAGKSSFVQAGVIPRLREQGRWLVLRLRPGHKPFRALANRLLFREGTSRSKSAMAAVTGRAKDVSDKLAEAPHRSPWDESDRLVRELAEMPERLALLLADLAEDEDCRVLLFVDQLEELYTLASDETVRRAFMRALCTAADDPHGPVRVVFSLRDDFIGRMAEGPEARAALSRVTVLRSPGPAALKEILTRPVRKAGYGYDDDKLVEDMILSVRGEPSALPLLQFACHRLWERRDQDRRLLTRRDYEGIGGVGGALARHVDGVLEGLSPAQMRQVRSLFLRLVTLEGTRRVLSRRELLEGLGEEASEVLERLTESRAVLVRKSRIRGEPEAELELVHESLIQKWEPLARWIEESREEMAFLAEARQAAELWEKRGRRDEEVWQGDALREARQKMARCAEIVPDLVKRFMEAGEKKERRRLARRRTLWAALIGSFAAAALVAVVIALVVAGKERVAVQRWAEAQREGAQAAFMRGDFLEARAKLRSSLEKVDSPFARALWWRLQQEPLVWKKKISDGIWSVAFSPDGKTVAGGCMNKSVFLIDVKTMTMRVLRGHQDQVTSVGFSPDGKHVAAATWGGQVWYWDIDRQEAKVLSGHQGGVFGTAFTPDGSGLASAGDDGRIVVWGLPQGTKRMELTVAQTRVRAVDFSPDGSLLAAGTADNRILLLDAATGVKLKEITGHEGGVGTIDFSPDGKILVSGSQDQSVRLWDVAAGKELKVFKGHASTVYSVRFKPDGKQLASGSFDKSIRLWDAVSGKVVMEIPGLPGMVTGVSFSPDGRLMASSSDDGVLRLWDTTASGWQNRAPVHTGIVNSVSFSPDGKLLASAGNDGTVMLWDAVSGAPARVLSGHTNGVYEAAFSPDGRVLASGGVDQSIRLWDVASGAQIKSLWGHTGVIMSVAISSDGKQLASSGLDKDIRLWDLESGTLTRTLSGHTGAVRCIRFSPDGKLLASASSDDSIRLWDILAGGEPEVLLGHKDGVWALGFDPDGTFLASGGFDGTLRTWDLETGEGKILKQLGGRIYKLQVHPDGDRVGSPCSDGTAVIVNLSDGSSVYLRGHRSEVDYLSFSPDGSLVATSSDDGTVRLWEADTGKPVWRAPLMLGDPPVLFSHLGWTRLDGAAAGGKPRAARWPKAVEADARQAAVSADAGSLCLVTHDDSLELWDLEADERVLSHPLAHGGDVLAPGRGCVVLADGQARLVHPDGKLTSLADDAGGIALSGEEILVATKRKVLIFSAQGALVASYPSGVGVTAMLKTKDLLIVGYEEGNIELIPLDPARVKPSFSFENVPSSPALRLLPGPMQTLVGGYGNGLLGIWSLENGKLLYAIQLHGPVVHLLLGGGKIYAATELGDYRVVDIGVFYQDYCDLLRDIWKDVVVEWEAGLPRLSQPPEDHPCAAQ
jgi:WD40 repeat protein